MPTGIYQRTEKHRGENIHNWKGDNVGYGALHDWIRKRLGTPNICYECGVKDENIKYQWANISGEYKRSNGLKDWKRLCCKCHVKFDIRNHPKGEKFWSAKLTKDKVIEIRKKYSFYKYGSHTLAKEFNVCPSTILRIVKKKLWKHI
jgi:hypothetical protein